MRYRMLDANGDMVFGAGGNAFFVNVPDAVAQAVLTRLLLLYGEWFYDTSDGTNWATGVLGPRTDSTRDAIVRDRVLGTPGVTSIASYSSSFDRFARKFSVSATVNTVYGEVTVTLPLTVTQEAPVTASTSTGAQPAPLDLFVLSVNRLD